MRYQSCVCVYSKESQTSQDVRGAVYTHPDCVCCVFAELGAGAELEGGGGRAAGRAGWKKRVPGESSPPQHGAQPHPETPRRADHGRGRPVHGEQASGAVEYILSSPFHFQNLIM